MLISLVRCPYHPCQYIWEDGFVQLPISMLLLGPGPPLHSNYPEQSSSPSFQAPWRLLVQSFLNWMLYIPMGLV